MSSDLEFNKAFAGVLIGGIVAMTAGMVASGLVHVEEPEKSAYVVEIDAGTGSASAVVEEEILPEVGPLLAAADLAKGEKLAKQKCGACHSFDNGGADGQGPNLWNIVDRDVAAHSGFGYSDALATMEGVWNYEALNGFLHKPKKYAPGTKMGFIGLKKEQDRANVIAWLRMQSSNPVPLPSPTAIEVEEAPTETAE